MEGGIVYFIDDDGDSSASLIKALKALGLTARMDAFTAASATLKAISKGATPEVVVLDLSLEPMRGVESGFELLSEILKISSDTRVIVLTGHGNDEFGIRALNAGAASFLEKPANPQHLAALIRDGISQSCLRRRNRVLEHQSEAESHGVIGHSAIAQKLREELDFLCSNSISVFLRGETGVGKSYFASQMHHLALKRGALKGNFISYAPRAGGADLISSDLFGHVKGAFTGAEQSSVGLLARANNGTFFLDEIDELPQEVQVTLLTVLQTKKYRPVGADSEVEFSARIVSASNNDYEESLKSGKLRSDLFHRLAQEIVIIPPLRDRREDIPDLSAAILKKIRIRENGSAIELDSSAKQSLSTFSWPGNIRQLENVIERAAARAVYNRRTTISESDLPSILGDSKERELTSERSTSFADQVESYKLKLIEDALSKCGGNQLKAAEMLNLDRSSLRRIYSRKK